MSKHVSFPAAHLSAYDIGKRMRVITIAGAQIEDTLCRITTSLDSNGKTRLFLNFMHALPTQIHSGREYDRGFEVKLDQMVKRIDDEG